MKDITGVLRCLGGLKKYLRATILMFCMRTLSHTGVFDFIGLAYGNRHGQNPADGGIMHIKSWGSGGFRLMDSSSPRFLWESDTSGARSKVVLKPRASCTLNPFPPRVRPRRMYLISNTFLQNLGLIVAVNAIDVRKTREPSSVRCRRCPPSRRHCPESCI